MTPYTLRIKGSSHQEDRVINDELDERLARLDVELHNRDNPDDQWIAGVLDETAS